MQQDASDEEAGSAASDPETQTQTQTATGVETMMKKLVRLALSCEYSRIPIRRTDISTKVLGETGTRQFKVVFERAQHELRTKFGMQMEELPSREKFTISQRRGKLVADKLGNQFTNTFSQLHRRLKRHRQRHPSHGFLHLLYRQNTNSTLKFFLPLKHLQKLPKPHIPRCTALS